MSGSVNFNCYIFLFVYFIFLYTLYICWGPPNLTSSVTSIRPLAGSLVVSFEYVRVWIIFIRFTIYECTNLSRTQKSEVKTICVQLLDPVNWYITTDDDDGRRTTMDDGRRPTADGRRRTTTIFYFFMICIGFPIHHFLTFS